MRSETLLFLFFAVCGVGILISLVSRPALQGRVLAWAGSLAGIFLVLTGGNLFLRGDIFIQPLWALPGLGTLNLTVDRLSAVFLFITGLVLLPASIYAGGDLDLSTSLRRGRPFTVILLGLYASIGLIFIAGDAVLFLLAWEVMSVFSYLLIVHRRTREDSPADAGYLLLAMGEAGTLGAALSFLILAISANSVEFGALRIAAPAIGETSRWAVFLLSFFGFGVKAGIVPVNLWLPRAYSVAPRAFVPVLAGATLNLGLYGIFRINADLMPASSSGPGLVALTIGTISALLGILYATTDNDLQAMLAHSSIENVGIVIAGFGAGMVFVATNHSALAVIAFVAGLYHLMNHSLYKTLLFFGVGAVEKQTGTGDMDQLGGLIKWMPLTALCFLTGTLSIAALPPFNGFVSEWLTLQTMLRSAALSSVLAKMIFALCGAGLALTAALAVTCFVKVFAMSFLGMRRLEEDRKVSEARSTTLWPMAILAVLCLLFGILPTYVIPTLGSALSPIVHAEAADALVPPFFASNAEHNTLPSAFAEEFHDLGAQVGQSILPGRGLVVMHRGGAANPVVFAMSTSYMLVALVALLLVTYLVIRIWLTRRRHFAQRGVWDGGIRRLLPEMTYTATGFSNPVRVIFDAVFRPTTVEDTRTTVAEHFRAAIRREKDREHLLDKLVFHPVKSAALGAAGLLASMHHGRFNAYAAYALVSLLVVLVVLLFQIG
jgi:hydrogenase-4 component B